MTYSSNPSHVFVEKTFGKPTHCAHCYKLLWGLTKQGLQCQACDTIVHKKCEDFVSLSCSRSPGRSSSKEPEYGGPSDDGIPARSRLAKQRSTVVINSKEESSRRRKLAAKKSRSSANFSDSNKINDSVNGSNIMQDLFVSAARNHIEAEKHSQAPALNLLTTTPKNMASFVMKIGPVFAIQEAVEKVFMWEDPILTMLIMALWVLICLHPILVVILPHLLLLRKIFNNYYTRARVLATTKPGKPSSSSSSHGMDMVVYKRNLQNIQNSMGQYVELHEALSVQLKVLDWSDEQATMGITKAIIACIPLTLAMFWVVPIKAVLLLGGLYPFIANTALARAAVSTLIPYCQMQIRARVRRAKKAVVKHISGSNGTERRQVRLFEAQRWWAGVGFTSRRMLASDPAPWSDELGAQALPPKELFVPPPGCTFAADSEWTIDSGFHSDCDGDENGWVYTDMNWNNPRKRSFFFSATRRRCWVRDIVPVHDNFTPSADATALMAYATSCCNDGLPTPPTSPAVGIKAVYAGEDNT